MFSRCVFLLTLSYANVFEVCYPEVVRHRIDSIFPTTRLFCVAKRNDEFEYGSVEIVNDGQQWKAFSKSRLETETASETYENFQVLYFRNPSVTRLFKLPASISESDFCTGTQSVELRRNLTISCKPLAVADMPSQCIDNDFLNAIALFGNGEYFHRSENKTVVIPSRNSDILRAPVWNGSACNNIVRSANLVFHMNETNIDEMEVHLEYGNLPGNVDNSWFQQEFHLRWIPISKKSQSTEENNQTLSTIGYKTGGQVYRVQNSERVPFAVPSLDHCYSSTVPPSPVLFLRPTISVCTIPTINCEDAQAKAKAFYDQVYPAELVSSFSADYQSAAVGGVNVTWEELSPSATSCRLPVSSLFQIYFSKQGSTTIYRKVIVAGKKQLILDDVAYFAGKPIRMPIAISFIDVTPPPRHVFAALPYIDIRLPHDFFYPFMSDSSAALSCHFHVLFSALIIARFL